MVLTANNAIRDHKDLDVRSEAGQQEAEAGRQTASYAYRSTAELVNQSTSQNT